MNKTLIIIKEVLKLAMSLEITFRKAKINTGDDYDKAIAQKTTARAIISMIPETGKKPDDTTEEDIVRLLKKYISQEKERACYELGYIKKDDVEEKTASEVRQIVSNTITELGDALTSHNIEAAKSHLPYGNAVTEEVIAEFISTIDLTQFKNKMQAMGLIMKQFPGCDGNLAKKVLLSC